ncbi:MAG: tetratricopeptide repeat protein [Candidatus Marinimicrobia bacterium]|nr:tetratricopeptide repeat protein [Candidatus Neomarinimicrobiota bacterium]
MNKQYLYEVLGLAEKRCGVEFSRKLLRLRKERERILNNVWKQEPLPEELPIYRKDIILRDIDFDTIVYHAAKYLGKTDYIELLNDIGGSAIKYGEFKRGSEILHVALKNAGQKNKEFVANILRKLGNIEFYTNDFQSAHKYFSRSLKLFTQIDNKVGIVSIKNVIGALLVEESKFYEGEIHFIQARKMAEEVNAPEMIAKANMNLGIIYNMRGLYEGAINCYQKALDANLGQDPELLSSIYINFAITYKFTQEYNTSNEYLDKTLDLIQETNNRYQKGLVYLIKAEVACLQGELSASTALVTSAFAIFSETGDRLSTAEAYKILGMINRQSKNYDVSLSYFENSRRIHEKITNPINLAETLVEMAKLYAGTGEKSRAKKTVNLAIRNFQKIGADSKVEHIKSHFGDLV